MHYISKWPCLMRLPNLILQHQAWSRFSTMLNILPICEGWPSLDNSLLPSPVLFLQWPREIWSQYMKEKYLITTAKCDGSISGSCPSEFSQYDKIPEGIITCVRIIVTHHKNSYLRLTRYDNSSFYWEFIICSGPRFLQPPNLAL